MALICAWDPTSPCTKSNVLWYHVLFSVSTTRRPCSWCPCLDHRLPTWLPKGCRYSKALTPTLSLSGQNRYGLNPNLHSSRITHLSPGSILHCSSTELLTFPGAIPGFSPSELTYTISFIWKGQWTPIQTFQIPLKLYLHQWFYYKNLRESFNKHSSYQ